MYSQIEQLIRPLLENAGVTGDISFTAPPKPEMGDVCFACFNFAKQSGVSPVEAAKSLELKIKSLELRIIDEVKAVGPYVNFFLNGSELAKEILKTITKEKKKYGMNAVGKKQKVLVEYGCMNPMKAFHLGHLRNLVTGESVARILENAGYKVLRTNYQGDVGMHIAKTLWGIGQMQNPELRIKNFDDVAKLPLDVRVAFLGKAYAVGAEAYESDEKAKTEILAYNEIVYGERKDARVLKIYKKARQWSLDYFEGIYRSLDTRYDYYYFESEMTRRAIELVKDAVREGTLKQSQGAVIFEGSKYGLHERVFLNQKGYPTYEAKEVALAEKHFAKHHPDKVIHVVGKEQTEYFKVLFKALEVLLPDAAGKEHHLIGGYLQLKGDIKMSSRSGRVVTGEELMREVEDKVREIMLSTRTYENTGIINPKERKQDLTNIDSEIMPIVQKVGVAALKYAMLRTGVSDDISFDMETSVSTNGDSGPYLLYIVARIKSILRKSQDTRNKIQTNPKLKISNAIEPTEKQLLLKLAEFPDATKRAAEKLDPSEVASYVFGLAQAFNTFYHACPVLQAEEDVRNFRLRLIEAVALVMERGLYLLGIKTVEEM